MSPSGYIYLVSALMTKGPSCCRWIFQVLSGSVEWEFLAFLAYLVFKFKIRYYHRVPSVRLSVSYFDFSAETTGPIQLTFGSNDPLLTDNRDCKAHSSFVTLSPSKWPTS